MQKISIMLAAFLAAALLAAPSAAMRFLAVTPNVAANVTVQIHVRLLADDGKPVAGAVKVTALRVDMSPDAMAGMTAPAKVLPSREPGVVVVETNLYAPGRWAVILSGSAGGKPVKGSVVITATQKSAEAASPPPAAHRILYYRNPMGLADTSPVPKKDAMGMAYIPVYADEVSKTRGAVRLSAGKMQRAGVRTTAVIRMPLSRIVRATGTVAADESRQAVLSPRFSGFVEKLYVTQTGDTVRAGQPLMRVWIESAEVRIKQADYIGSLASGAQAHAASAASQLRQYGIAQSDLSAMAKSGMPTRTLTVAAPASGTVMEKNVVQGMHFAAGDTLFKTTDLSRLWVLAEVSERDLAFVKPGQKAVISFRDDPAASFEGKVLMLYPQLDMATRTTKVRISVANKDGRLRIGQYAEVRIEAPSAKGAMLAVPLSAVIDDGTRQIAFVAKPGGLFEPRALKLGARNGQMVEVVAGLNEGERVVSAGNFLIDAESNLQSAVQTFGNQP